MLKTILTSFSMAFSSIRTRFFHTLLSVLGIVIGVGALVAILSLIDGMEKYANEQITKTTSLKSILVQSDNYHLKNGVRVKKDTVVYVNFEDFQSLNAAITIPNKNYFITRFTWNITEVKTQKEVATFCYFSNEEYRDKDKISKGRFFDKNELLGKKHVAVVNQNFARLVDSTSIENVIGKKIAIKDFEPFEIIGITNVEEEKQPKAYFPISHLTHNEFYQSLPQIIYEADDVKDVSAIKEDIETWVATRYGDQAGDIKAQSQDFRIKQANEGFLIFRIIMGMIVGLSVLVGGIGVMNVLLISVSERTSEIGIRKALGASKKTIIAQFMSESIAVSIFGSFVGVLFGMGFALAAMPILKHFADVPFTITFTYQTMIIIAVISILIGIVFGTYPAIKASRLDPVVAIQRE